MRTSASREELVEAARRSSDGAGRGGRRPPPAPSPVPAPASGLPAPRSGSGLAREAQHRGGTAEDHLEVGLEVVVAEGVAERVVALHLLLEAFASSSRGAVARDLQPGLAVQVGGALELVADLLAHAPPGRWDRAGAAARRAGTCPSPCGSTGCGSSACVGVQQHPRRQERVGGAQALEGQAPGCQARRRSVDLPLRVLEDVHLLLRAVAGIEAEGGHRVELHARGPGCPGRTAPAPGSPWS